MAITWGVNIFTFLPIQRDLSTYLLPRFFPQSYSSQVPDHPAKPLPQPMVLICRRVSGHFSFQEKWTTSHQDGFPSPRSFRDVPERAVWLQLPLPGGACKLCRSVCEPGSGLLSLCLRASCPWGRRYRRGDRRQYSWSGVHGRLDPFVQLFTPSGPSWVQSCIYHFHSTMECCCAWPKGGPVAQMTPSLWWAAQVSWQFGGFQLSVQSFLRLRSRPRGLSQKERIICGWWYGLAPNF